MVVFIRSFFICSASALDNTWLPLNAYINRVTKSPQTEFDIVLAYLKTVDPVVYGCIALHFIVLLFACGPRGARSLSCKDRLIGWWMLLNGVYIHILMDGLTGFMDRVPSLGALYHILDNRYQLHEIHLDIISCSELVIYAPICIACYIAIHRRSNIRYPLQIIASIFQLFGTIIYVGAEVFTGLKHVPVDRELSFTPFYLLYFWFACVFCNFQWIWIPIAVTVNAYNTIVQTMDKVTTEKKVQEKTKKNN